MTLILPPGEHYGTPLQKWSSTAFTVSEVRYSAGLQNPPHGNEQGLLVFVERGTYAKRVEHTEFACSQDEVLYIPAKRCQADLFGPNDTICLIVDCSSSLLERVYESGAKIDEFTRFSGPEFLGLMAQLCREFRNSDSVSGLVFEGILLAVFAQGFRLWRSSFGPRVPAWLVSARDLLHDCFTESFTMESIARQVGVHPVHLSHEFRKYYQVTPGTYLRRLRVDFAAKRLQKTTLPLAEIAIASGFADQAHFSRTFRRLTNLTPSQFRQLMKRP